jgi:hypothetical protein
MLALKQALSLNTIKKTSGGGGTPWVPSDEDSCVAWFKNKYRVNLESGTSNVRAWVSEDALSTWYQYTTSEQPAYDASTGAITFDDTATQNISGTEIELSDEFTIGMRLHVASAGGIIIGDNTDAGEFFKLFSNSILRVKIDNVSGDLELDSGTWFSDSYLVITRDSSNVLNLWWNGVKQVDTTTISGTADIDTLGVRKTDLNPYDGSISEVEIFSSESATLTANVNARLETL